ncbi:MAG: hypothetical protein Q4F06_06390 [Eubacteriales bacterium]|nr:hypothetical protein [Eubacteriales bacterium]
MKINISEINHINTSLYYIIRDIATIQSEINDVQCSLDSDVLNSRNIGYNLSKTNNSVIKATQEMRDLYSFVEDSTDKYTSLEGKLTNTASGL